MTSAVRLKSGACWLRAGAGNASTAASSNIRHMIVLPEELATDEHRCTQMEEARCGPCLLTGPQSLTAGLLFGPRQCGMRETFGQPPWPGQETRATTKAG